MRYTNRAIMNAIMHTLTASLASIKRWNAAIEWEAGSVREALLAVAATTVQEVRARSYAELNAVYRLAVRHGRSAGGLKRVGPAPLPAGRR